MEQSLRKEAMKLLDIFTGEWKLELIHPHFEVIYGLSSYSWMAGNSFLIQNTNIDHQQFPDYMNVFDYDPDSGNYVQHYFDTRGVARLCKMRLENGVWKQWRDTPDFSELNFSQRFLSTINDSGDTIQCTLEKSFDGATWEHDFVIIYRKIK
jgi:hypothetical protein